MMKYGLGFFLALLMSLATHAQMAFEVKAGSGQAQYFAFQQLQIDSAGRWGMFASQLYLKPYQPEIPAVLALENQLSYQLLPGIGLSAGVAMGGAAFRANVGLALEYFNRKGDFYISAYPTWVPGAAGSLELFFVSEYSPQWNSRWGFFGQWIGGIDAARKPMAGSSEPTFRYASNSHFIRLGINYRQKWQAGWGADVLHERGMGKLLVLPGFFLRRALG